MGCALLASALVMTLFTKSYSLTRGKPSPSRTSSGETTVCDEAEGKDPDPEKADEVNAAPRMAYGETKG